MCLAVPGKILSIDDTQGELVRTGKVSFGGIVKDVNLAYTPEAKVDDYVIVHVGFALNTLDESEALKVFEYLKEMDELDIENGKPSSGDSLWDDKEIDTLLSVERSRDEV